MIQSVSDSVFIRSLYRQPVPRTPVWMMRQAGRYLPEYRAVRAKAGDFLSLCKNKDFACEVALQPLRRFALDAAILFSDILTIPDSLGLGLSFQEGEGPVIARPVRDARAIDALPMPVAKDDLHYVMEAVQLTRKEMPAEIPLIGFSGSPWTLACYMIEGRGGREFKQAIRLMYDDPVAMHVLLLKLTSIVGDYLNEQIIAGVNAVMIFDTWGGLLSAPNYRDFSLNYMSNITQFLKSKHPTVPVILFTKGASSWLDVMANSGCDALGLDWTCDLTMARRTVGDRVALQGNLDPAVLLGSHKCIREHVQQVLAAYGEGSGHIFNLGHGITPDVPVENVATMLNAVHEHSVIYHQD